MIDSMPPLYALYRKKQLLYYTPNKRPTPFP